MNFEKYTIKAQEVLQKSAEIALAHQQQVIENGHLLKGIAQQDDNLFSFICNKLGANKQYIIAQTDNTVQKYPKSSGGNPYLSNDAAQTLQKAEKYKEELKDEFIAVEHILLGIVAGKDIISQLLKGVGFTESGLKKAIQELRGGKNVKDQNAESRYKSLERYSKNLNELAKAGKIDPIIGRDEEIRRVLQILARRTKNNPMLIGVPGVGKTAIAEGLAQRIVSGDVPENLKHIEIVALDLGLLIAGAKYKGEFEERLKSVVQEVIDSNGRIVLFIDEIHTLIGAGAGGDSAMDAANLLKPALARGELRAIGATTLNEYQKYIEKDKALERRFQTVFIDEPSVPDAISILRGIKEKYEVHHGVRIKDEAIVAAVELSHRYITDRYLPDKAIDLMDEAAARIRMQIDSLPEELDNVQRAIMQREIEREAMRREGDTQREKELAAEIANLNEQRNSLKARWEEEKQIIEQIKKEKETIERAKVEAEQAERNGDYGRVAELRYGVLRDAERRMESLQKTLKERYETQGALLKQEVTAEEIAEIVSKWTGIPVQKMLQSEREKLLHLEEELSKRVAGQTVAIQALSDAVRRSRAGLQDPRRPIGSFIFLGTTGVGKTELAKALADFLFNDESAIVRIDMSEYQEAHSVSRLIGAPPGYVGYDEGGQLTEAVRRKPYSVVLLDEIEKAHPDVFNILLQVLDEGRLTDNKGRVANFKNTIIIMTSNLGSHIILENYANFEEENRSKIARKTREQVLELLKKSLRPEFLNRIDEIIVFEPLSKAHMRKIVEIQFADIQKRLSDNGITLEPNDEVFDYLAEIGYDPQFGARPLKRIIQQEVLNELSKEILKGNISRDSSVSMFLNDNKIIFFNKRHEPVA
ncbi:MAG: ATP-dependent chaperone ClpB [Cytophagales bacterium]|nr:ATP-dependent chaperone ClpB [Cytophagales bacterium]MDW8384502.1 ATP-dependent chaperone ClpB [Flammeovirgaceae bacterium]